MTILAFAEFMREKSEVLAKFREFEALVTNHTVLHIDKLGSDNVGAYVVRDFEKYLSGGGIRRQPTVR